MAESLEEQLVETCPNCKEEHKAKFFSLFVGDMHYVTGECGSCGYVIELPLHDFGGGIFMPDGTPISEQFKTQQSEDMKQRVETGSSAGPRIRLQKD